MEWSTLFAIIGSLVGTVSGAVAIIISLRKTPSEIDLNQGNAADKISTAWSTLIAPLTARVEQLEKEIIGLKLENALLRNWAERLVIQVKTLGGIPVAMDEKKIE